VSYADFITLLFAFFVVMYSTSAVNVGDFRVLSDSIVQAFGLPGMSPDSKSLDHHGTLSSLLGTPRGSVIDEPQGTPLRSAANDVLEKRTTDFSSQEEIEGLEVAVESSVGDLIAPDRFAVTGNDKWLEIQIPARMLFPSGSRALLASSRPMLKRLADTLNALPNEVVVQGHTDDQPIRNGLFPSNWELSTSRAAAIARVFEEEGVDPRRLSAVGFGPNRPIAENTSEEGRAENRRVVLLIRSALLSEAAVDG